MKKILILFLGLTMTSSAIIADGEEVKQGSVDRMVQMQKNLSLSDQQVAQMRQIRDNGGGREEILAVLTDEQLAIMKARYAQGSDDRLAQMEKNLGLSDQQVAQIRQIRDNGGSREEVLAVLTDEQLAIMKERRAQMKTRGRKGKQRPPTEDNQNSEPTDS